MIVGEAREYLVTVCKILRIHKVDFIVVGGAAVSYYGYRRPSVVSIHRPQLKADLDFWYKPTIENFECLLKALEDLGVDVSELSQITFDPQHTFLKIPHSTFHTDFLPVMKGLPSYKNSKDNAEETQLDGVPIAIISYQDLMINKMAVGRQSDHNDLAVLKNLNAKRGHNQAE